MAAASLRTFVRRLFTSSARAVRPAARRLAVEALEDRLLLSVRVWDGSADGSGVPFGNSNWTSPQNWVGDVAPVAGDSLVFPAAAQQYTTTTTFPAGTAFSSLSFSGSGYTLGGNAVALAAGITTSNPAGTATPAVNAVNLPLTFTAA